jgi:hypothetical protein
MTNKTQKAYAVWSNTDLTEGRGYEYALHICSKEATAIRLSKGAYVMGSDARVTEIELIFHNNRWCGPVYLNGPNTADTEMEKKLELKRKAEIAKAAVILKAQQLGLTAEDIAALKG